MPFRSKRLSESKPVLVADIGGTHTTLALFQEGQLRGLEEYSSQKINNFPRFIEQVLQNLRREWALVVDEVCIGAAGPISKNKKFCQLTNLSWSIDVDAVQERSHLRRVLLLNDFEAIAYGMDALDKRMKITIKKGKPAKKETRVLLGAGTGLGKCTLVFDDNTESYHPLLSELGHANASLSTEEDFRLAWFIQKKKNRKMVSWQDVLSGEGLKNIYQFLQSTSASDSRYCQEIIRSNYDPSLMAKHKYTDALSHKTFQMFARYYARCAKIIAMDSLAMGGVFVAGGIAAKNVDIFKREEFGFHAEFLNVRKLKYILDPIPIYVIRDQHAGLYGAGIFLKKHTEQ